MLIVRVQRKHTHDKIHIPRQKYLMASPLIVRGRSHSYFGLASYENWTFSSAHGIRKLRIDMFRRASINWATFISNRKEERRARLALEKR